MATVDFIFISNETLDKVTTSKHRCHFIFDWKEKLAAGFEPVTLAFRAGWIIIFTICYTSSISTLFLFIWDFWFNTYPFFSYLYQIVIFIRSVNLNDFSNSSLCLFLKLIFIIAMIKLCNGKWIVFEISSPTLASPPLPGECSTDKCIYRHI